MVTQKELFITIKESIISIFCTLAAQLLALIVINCILHAWADQKNKVYFIFHKVRSKGAVWKTKSYAIIVVVKTITAVTN